MPFLGFIGAAAPAVSAVTGAISSVAGLVGGGGGGERVGICPGMPSPDAVQRMLSTAPPDRLRELRRLHDAGNSASWPSDPNVLSHRALGGNDCRMSQTDPNSIGNQFQRLFFELLEQYGGESNGATALAPAAGATTDAFGNQWRQNPVTKAWEVLQELPGRVLGGAIEGAAEAAAGTASRAAQPILAERSRSALQQALPLILIGFAVANFLRR